MLRRGREVIHCRIAVCPANASIEVRLCGRDQFGARNHAANASDTFSLGESVGKVLQPARVHNNVVVCEGDQTKPSALKTNITSDRQALSSGLDQSNPCAAEGMNNRRRKATSWIV